MDTAAKVEEMDDAGVQGGAAADAFCSEKLASFGLTRPAL
jgi:hypothetical protein